MRDSTYCYAHGRPGNWEAICIDFDISVQAASLDEAKARLAEAIDTYVEDALNEDPITRDRLLNRRVPWYVRLKFAALLAMYTFIKDREDRKREAKAGFPLPCHA